MRKIVLFLAMTACAHGFKQLPSEKARAIQPGASIYDVATRLGPPQSQEVRGKGEVLVYADEEGTCELYFENQALKGWPTCGHSEYSLAVKERKRRNREAAFESMANSYRDNPPTSVGHHMLNKKRGGQCSGFAPIPDHGCRPVCIDGEWSQVCR